MHILENKKGLPSIIQLPTLKNQNKESKLNQGKQKEESITDKEKKTMKLNKKKQKIFVKFISIRIDKEVL